jgi:hypothetical protein
MPVIPGNAAFSAGEGIVESYVDNLELLELKDNKLYKLAGTVQAKGPEHFWVKDEVRASKSPSAAAKGEGVQFAGQRGSDPVRIWNTAQLFHEDVQVTGTLQRTDHIGIDDRFAFEAEKQEKAVAKDIERAMIYGARNQGAYTDGTSTQTANRAMGGIVELVTNNAASNVVAAAGAALDEDLFNSYVQNTWTNSDREKDLDVFTGAKQKGNIDLFTTPNQRNIEAKSRMIVLPVDTIATNFGAVNLHLHREVEADDLIGVDTSVLYKASLLAPRTEKYAKRGDSIDGAVEAELTVELRRPENCFVTTGLSVA